MRTYLFACAVAGALSLTGPCAAAVQHTLADEADAFAGFRAVTDDLLEEMRGGFQVAVGGLPFEFSFSIERSTFVNGQLATTTRLSLDQPASAGSPGQSPPSTLSIPLSASPAAVASQTNVVQNGLGNAFTPGMLAPSALFNLIQNSLDNQVIRQTTLINAAVTNLDLFRAAQLDRAIDREVLNSVR
jgi:hypothetical protein